MLNITLLFVVFLLQKTMRCDPTAYFELDSIDRDFYLLNIRISARVKNNAMIKLFVKQLTAKVSKSVTLDVKLLIPNFRT